MELTHGRKNINISYRIIAYILLMLAGIAISTYITHTITIVWIVNLIGLAILFLPFFRYTNPFIVKVSLLYIAFCMITIGFNIEYLNMSAKAIGTNVNILVVPVILNIIYSAKRYDLISDDSVGKILGAISTIGLLTLIFALAVSYRDIVGVFGGMNAYSADVSGFFYSKNIYGTFISLTAAADIYLLNQNWSMKRLLIIGIKIVAVIVSFSRASLLQMGIMIFLFIWLKKKRRVRDYLFLISGIGIIAAVFMIMQSNEQFVKFVIDAVLRLDAGDAGRQYFRLQAMQKIGGSIVSILFGVGFAGIEQLSIDVDNTYLYILFSGGIAKCVFYLCFLLTSFRNIFMLKKVNEPLYRICISVAISYLVFAFFESVAVLELGLLNLLFTLFMFFFPIAYKKRLEVQ